MYWFTDPALKNLLPLAGASAFKGLSTTFRTPMLIMGANALPEGPALGASVIDIMAVRCSRKRAFIVTDEYTVKEPPGNRATTSEVSTIS